VNRAVYCAILERSIKMFERILVPLDGSARAERAIPVAARLTRASGGVVVLLRVAGFPSAFAPYTLADPWTVQRIIDADVAEAQEYLEGVAGLHRLQGVRVETEVIVGTAANTILSVAGTGRFGLIVLCSHGSSGMRRWMLGSVAEKVARYAPVPVLLLREGGPALAGVSPQVEDSLCALIPLDGSARAEAALLPAARLIAALAAPGPASLHLTRVVAQLQPTESGQREWEARMHETRQYLSAAAAHLRESLEEVSLSTNRIAITWSIICDDDIAAGILRVAETGEVTEAVDGVERADVIAMATHGYSGIQRWALGSITERVLHACKLPILVVRPAEMIDEHPLVQEPVKMVTRQ
jgi:nucleotide-binding universal stress UspA family protein